jgi:hypothetical protein
MIRRSAVLGRHQGAAVERETVMAARYGALVDSATVAGL